MGTIYKYHERDSIHLVKLNDFIRRHKTYWHMLFILYKKKVLVKLYWFLNLKRIIKIIF